MLTIAGSDLGAFIGRAVFATMKSLRYQTIFGGYLYAPIEP